MDLHVIITGSDPSPPASARQFQKLFSDIKKRFSSVRAERIIKFEIGTPKSRESNFRPTNSGMDSVSNSFSILNLDDDGDKTKESKKRSCGVSAEEEFRKPLVWIDLEMTGLNVEVDRILEIACVITDGKLTKSVEGPDLVISQPKECLDNMDEWCRDHHGASGLTKRVLESTITEYDAEKQVIEFVKKHIDSDNALLAGNSVYMDLLFLKKYMPNLAAIFCHVLVDVSSISALCARWFPKEKMQAPAKEKNHRAMDDIKESINELKYYKESIFKGRGKPSKSKR